jgi:ribosome recycling factor
MQKSLEALKNDLAKVRTGRAHTGLLDHVRSITTAPWCRSIRSPTSP